MPVIRYPEYSFSRIKSIKYRFMNFRKEDLAMQHYRWASEPGRFVYTGDPSRRIFDRLNGEQVLFVINALGSMLNIVSLHEFLEIEALIARKLPQELRSEISVIQWLKTVAG